ncbi:MAG: LptF/LptG family permease, partial [Spirochaetales bacterium]
NENCEFILEIPDVDSAHIEIEHKDFPANINFILSTKRDSFIKQDNGTLKKGVSIVYILEFTQAGIYDPGTVTIRINDENYEVSFPQITVFENLALSVPELYLEAQGSIHELQNATLLLSARYFQSIDDISWDLTEDALFEQTSSLLSIPSETFTFSETKIPIAVFSYTAFEQGIYELPVVTATFTAYNGNSYTIKADGEPITVLPTAQYSQADYTTHENDIASNSVDESQSTVQNLYNPELATTLALLRLEEKYSIFPFIAQKQRIDSEKAHNIQQQNEPSFLWTLIAGTVSLCLLIIGFIFCKMKKKSDSKMNFCFLCVIIGFIFLCVSIFYTVQLLPQYALTTGGRLYIIPEFESHNFTSVTAGIRVRILQSTGDWYLVSLPDGRNNWILKDDCILIEKDFLNSYIDL